MVTVRVQSIPHTIMGEGGRKCYALQWQGRLVCRSLFSAKPRWRYGDERLLNRKLARYALRLAAVYVS